MQYNRKAQLIVADEAGNGIDLSNLRITFNVKKTSAETPNSAEFRVYNLTKDTMNQITREFTQVVLSAGYADNYGLIFRGNIKQTKIGRENATDNYIDIAAGDGDEAYNFAVVNATLSAGATPAEVVATAQRSMEPRRVTQGYVAPLPNVALPRGKVLYGMARDYLRDVATTSNAQWSIQDGALQILPRTAVLPGEAVVLNSRTGLVGVPEETNDGVTIRALLNPQIRVGGAVQIDEGIMSGLYSVIAVEFSGDTRGQDWYVTITALLVDSTTGRTKPL